ncbi:MAG: hypothetical protein PHF84_11505, partial [bacterium]|nr:hypothetical protein [bacterium]
MNSKLSLFLLAWIGIFGLSTAFASLYYSDGLSSGSGFSNCWDLDYRYGREGFIVNNASTATQIVSDRKLNITGMPLINDGSYSYHMIWVGRCVKLTNLYGRRTFNASEYEPFGFELVRTSSRMWHGNSSGWPEDCGEVNIWLIEENNVKESNWHQLDNYIYFYEGMKYIWGTSSRWGYYKGAENRCFLTNVKRPDNKKADLTTGPYNLEYNYNGGAVNNNDVGIRITYDGSRVGFYVNPDPSDGNAYPNEYCYLRDTSFPITNNLRIMLGHANNGTFPTTQTWRAVYTNILIRTI